MILPLPSSSVHGARVLLAPSLSKIRADVGMGLPRLPLGLHAILAAARAAGQMAEVPGSGGIAEVLPWKLAVWLPPSLPESVPAQHPLDTTRPPWESPPHRDPGC